MALGGGFFLTQNKVLPKMKEIFFMRFLGKLLCQNASKQQRDSLITSILYQRQERLQRYQTEALRQCPL